MYKKKRGISAVLILMAAGIILSGCGKKETASEKTVGTTGTETADTGKKGKAKKADSELEKYVDFHVGFQMMVPKDVYDQIKYGFPMDSNYQFNYGGTDSHPESEIMLGPYWNSLDKTDEEFCDLDAIKGPEDILDNMAYKIAMCYHRVSSYDPEKLTKDDVKKDSVEKIKAGAKGEFDAVKWKGEISLPYMFDDTYDTYKYVAYGLIGSDGRPYLFVGSDLTKDGSRIDFLEKTLDGMVATFVENPLPKEYSLTDVKGYHSGEWLNYR